jgi:hypothetical protein
MRNIVLNNSPQQLPIFLNLKWVLTTRQTAAFKHDSKAMKKVMPIPRCFSFFLFRLGKFSCDLLDATSFPLSMSHISLISIFLICRITFICRHWIDMTSLCTTMWCHLQTGRLVLIEAITPFFTISLWYRFPNDDWDTLKSLLAKSLPLLSIRGSVVTIWMPHGIYNII